MNTSYFKNRLGEIYKQGYNKAIKDFSLFIHEEYQKGIFTGFDVAIITEQLEILKRE